ncbi:MAG: hypothetical protein ACREGA_04185 [Candidatus Saccharimonadales bacterium]
MKNFYNPKSKNQSGRLLALLIILVLIIVAVAAAYRPLANHYVLANARPKIKSLAVQAGLSRTGKLILFKTHPRLVSTGQLASDCGVKQGKKFIEQGCFVAGSSGREQIYLRQMPASLHGVEIVTAAHEMLHAAYAKLNSSTKNSVNQQVLGEYKTLENKDLNARLADYAVSEPGQRGNELHSILGTEFAPLPQKLTNYYHQYFTNRGKVVAANKQITQKFASLKTKINQQQAAVYAGEARSNSLFSASGSAAAAGNAQSDNYYYARYSQEVNTINHLISQYNQSVNQYNTLAAEYNGQPQGSIPKLPTKTS